MNKIDRLGWEREQAFIAYGVPFAVRVNEHVVFKDAIERLPPGSKNSSAKNVDYLYSLIGYPAGIALRPRRLNLAYYNLDRIVRAAKFPDLLNAFESHLQLTVAEHARRRVFVHAGVVGWKGRAILLPGRSFSGKTTLVAELIKAGATYYSDEYAVIDERGRVHPYARLLGLRRPGLPESNRIRAEEMGAQVGVSPLRVGLVVSTTFKEKARWRPRQLTRGQGVLELLGNTVTARTQPKLALSVLPKALRGAQVLKSARGQAIEVIDAILRSAG